MNFKWFRMLFPPLNGDMRQICLRRTAPQSKTISKNLKQARFVSTVQQQSRLDIIKKNADLLEQISKKSKLSSCTRLTHEKSEPTLKKKLSPFVRSRPSSRCFIRSSGSIPRRNLRSFYLGQAQSKLSKKISTIERFHTVCEENRIARHSASSSLGASIESFSITPPKQDDRNGFLSRPTTRRIQTCGLTNWTRSYFPQPSLNRKDTLTFNSSSNMQLVRTTIRQNKVDFSSKEKELSNALLEKIKKRRKGLEGYVSAGAPNEDIPSFFGTKNSQSSISLRKSSKALDLPSGSSLMMSRPKSDCNPGSNPSQHVNDIPQDPTQPVLTKKMALDMKNCVFEPPAFKTCYDQKSPTYNFREDKITKNMKNPVTYSHLVKESGKSKGKTKSVFHLVKNPASGKLDIKEMKPEQGTQNAVFASRVPPELSEKTFKESFLVKFTPAQPFLNYKTVILEKFGKLPPVKTEADYAKQVQETKKKKVVVPIKKPLIDKSKHHIRSSDQAKLVWQKNIFKKPSTERLPTPQEMTLLGNTLEKNSLKSSPPQINLTVGGPPKYEKPDEVGYKEPVYQSFCQIAKSKQLLRYVPKTKPKLKITFPSYGANYTPVQNPVASMKQMRTMKTLKTPESEPKEESNAFVESGTISSLPPKSQPMPNGLLSMCRNLTPDLPSSPRRGAHALYTHRPKKKVSVTHNIKKPSAASLENLFKNRLRQRGLKSYKMSQANNFTVSKMDLVSSLDALSRKDTQVPVKTRPNPIPNLPIMPSPTANDSVTKSEVLTDNGLYKFIPGNQPLTPCKLCGLFHSLSAQGKCPLAELMKESGHSSLNPLLNSIFKRTYSTSCKGGIYPTTAEEWLHVCKYCGLVHNDPSQVCPMKEALKLFMAEEKKHHCCKISYPVGVNKFPSKFPKKEMMIKRIQTLQDKLKLYKMVKMANQKRLSENSGINTKALMCLPPSKFACNNQKPCHCTKNTGLRSVVKRYNKQRTAATMKYGKKLNGENLAKFSKSLGGLLKNLLQECHLGLKLDKNAQIVDGRMNFLVQMGQAPKHKNDQNEQRRISKEVVEDSTLHPARSNTPQKDETRNTKCLPPSAQQVKPTIKPTQFQESKELVCRSIQKTIEDSRQSKYNFEIICKKINSTRKSNSTSGNRNFNTSCVYASSNRKNGSKTPPLEKKPKTPGQIAHIHKSICPETNRSEIRYGHQKPKADSKVVEVSGYPTFHDPKITEKWNEYKSCSVDENNTENNDEVKKLPESPLRMLALGRPQVNVREKKMKDCITQLKNQVNKAECDLKKNQDESVVPEKSHKTFKISLGTISNNGVTKAQSDIVFHTSGKITQGNGKSLITPKTVLKGFDKPRTKSLENMKPPTPKENMVLKVLLKEEPLKGVDNIDMMSASRTLTTASADRQSRSYSSNDTPELFRHSKPSPKQVFRLASGGRMNNTTSASSGTGTSDYVKKGRQAAIKQGAKGSKDDEENCPPPSCTICSKTTDPCANRKLCSKDENFKDTVTQLMKIENCCELELLQARMKKQRERLESQKKEEEFYKYYKCDAHRTHVAEACVFQEQKTCEEPCPEEKSRPPCTCKAQDTDGTFPKESDCAQMKFLQEDCKVKEKEPEKKQRPCEMKTVMFKNKPISRKMCYPSEPETEPDRQQRKSREFENNIFYPQMCQNALKPSSAPKTRAFTKENRKLKEIEDIDEYSSKPEKSYDMKEKKVKENRRSRDSEDKENDLEWEDAQKNEKLASAHPKAGTKKFTDGDQCVQKEKQQLRKALSTTRPKAQKYQFTKPSTELVIELVTEDYSHQFKQPQEVKASDHKKIEKCGPSTEVDKKKLHEVLASCKQHNKKEVCEERDHHVKVKEKEQKTENYEDHKEHFKYEFQEPKEYKTKPKPKTPVKEDNKKCDEDKYKFKEEFDDKPDKQITEEELEEEIIVKPKPTPKQKKHEDLKLEVDTSTLSSPEKPKMKIPKFNPENEHQMDAQLCKTLLSKRKDIIRLKKSNHLTTKPSKSYSRKFKSLLTDDEDFESDKTTYSDAKLMRADMKAKSKDMVKAEVPVVSRDSYKKLFGKDARKDEHKEKDDKNSIKAEAVTGAKEQPNKNELDDEVKKQAKISNDPLIDLYKSLHICYAEEQLKKASDETLKCKLRDSKSKLDVKQDCTENPVEAVSKENNVKYCAKPVNPLPSTVRQDYRLESIRNDKDNYVDQEIKKLEVLQKEIKPDEAKKLFYQDKIRTMQKKMAEFVSMKSIKAENESDQCIYTTIQDYKKSLELKTCPEVMSLGASSGKIADEVYQKLLKSSEKKIAILAQDDDTSVGTVSDLLAQSHQSLEKSGVKVCKADGSVQELSETCDLGSRNSRMPNKKWSEKISDAMYTSDQKKKLQYVKGPKDLETEECTDKTKSPEVQFPTISKGQMEVICHQVLKEIEARRRESSSCCTNIPPRRISRKDIVNPRKVSASTLITTKPREKTVSTKPESQPKWKYLDQQNIYDYNHYETSSDDKTGLQLHKCMREVKRCLDDYKKCLIDLKLMPTMDKHFEYEGSEVSVSSPHLPITRRDAMKNMIESDVASIASSSKITGHLKEHNRRVVKKCSKKLSAVPLLLSGKHPISTKSEKSTTSFNSQKNRQHHHSSESIGPHATPDTDPGLLAKHKESTCNLMKRKASLNNIHKHRGYHQHLSANKTKDNLEEECRRHKESFKNRKNMSCGNENCNGDIFDEVTLYFPRGEQCVNVELLFHEDESLKTSKLVASSKVPSDLPGLPIDLLVPQTEPKCVRQNEVVSDRDDLFMNVKIHDTENLDTTSNQLSNFPDEAGQAALFALRPLEKYSYARLTNDKQQCEEIDGNPVESVQTFSKPMQLFQQLYEVTTNKLKSMTNKTQDGKSQGFMSTPDDFWPKEFYPQIYSLPGTPLTPKYRPPFIKTTQRPVSRDNHNYINKDIGLLTARVLSRPVSQDDKESQGYQDYRFTYGAKTLARQKSLTNILKDACKDLKQTTDKCCKDLKKTLGYQRKHN